MAKRYLVLISRICLGLVASFALIAYANVCAYVYLRPALPDVGSLRNVQLQVPLRIYTRDGRLMAAIGDQRRIPVRYDELPKKLIQAFLATEDDRFFQHHGVDWQGILRAALANFRAGRISQGASTITMQVSRDMFLTPKRDMKRKMSEVYISLLMETEFTKEEIFSLYVNKIFLGQRAYGVAAAAEVYFGKSLDQLTIAEMATLAGIPTAPSVVNPVASAEAARVRRTHVLGRMRELGYITQAEYDEANATPMVSRLHGPTIEVDAPYVAEMVRNEMLAKYGDNVYTAGYRVYTTIDSRLESAATVALRAGLLQYDRRHGWRGATAKVDLDKIDSGANLDLELEEYPAIGGLRPAIVQSVDGKSARIYVKNLGPVTLPWEKLSVGAARTSRGEDGPLADPGLGDLQPRRRDLHRGQHRRRTCSSCRCPRRRARWWPRIPRMEPSWRWWADSTFSRANSTGPPRPGANPVRGSSPSSMRRPSTRDTRRPASCSTPPS